jgi:hypothetical protein
MEAVSNPDSLAGERRTLDEHPRAGAYGLIQREPSTGRTWLAFPSRPPESVREDLKRTGWRYHGGLRAWWHADPHCLVPAGVTSGAGPDCANSSLRSIRRPGVLALLTRAKAAVRAHLQSGSPA